MKFLTIYTRCSYLPGNEPICISSVNREDVSQTQVVIDNYAVPLDNAKKAENYELNEKATFTDHIPTKHLFKQFIIMRIE